METTTLARPVEHTPLGLGACHCGQPLDRCPGCGSARCPRCEPVQSEDCRWDL